MSEIKKERKKRRDVIEKEKRVIDFINNKIEYHQKISFSLIATELGISKTFLYNNPEIRKMIEDNSTVGEKVKKDNFLKKTRGSYGQGKQFPFVIPKEILYSTLADNGIGLDHNKIKSINYILDENDKIYKTEIESLSGNKIIIEIKKKGNT
jgi:hypothetical protein